MGSWFSRFRRKSDEIYDEISDEIYDEISEISDEISDEIPDDVLHVGPDRVFIFPRGSGVFSRFKEKIKST